MRTTNRNLTATIALCSLALLTPEAAGQAVLLDVEEELSLLLKR